ILIQSVPWSFLNRFLVIHVEPLGNWTSSRTTKTSEATTRAMYAGWGQKYGRAADTIIRLFPLGCFSPCVLQDATPAPD
ncbi:MAG TPA: hypothetical protein PLW83_06500, partial [Deltaproteobacteria bacterium]|nr:hypothetical protein [Deltaproteobacteria bacterium]